MVVLGTRLLLTLNRATDAFSGAVFSLCVFNSSEFEDLRVDLLGKVHFPKLEGKGVWSVAIKRRLLHALARGEHRVWISQSHRRELTRPSQSFMLLDAVRESRLNLFSYFDYLSFIFSRLSLASSFVSTAFAPLGSFSVEVHCASCSSRASFLDLVASPSIPHVRGRRTTAYRLSSLLFSLVASPSFLRIRLPTLSRTLLSCSHGIGRFHSHDHLSSL